MNRAARIALIVSAALASLGFLALAVWQVQRLSWKEDLIARVERQVHAEPVAPPAVSAWASVGKPDEYRRLRLQGRFEPRATLVQATTELGGGYWVIAPLRLDDGGAILVNRGFVPSEQRAPETHAAPAGPVEIVGLLRLSEPGGGPLRHNEPAQGRWYSRDVAGIAAQAGVAGPVAPFFVDESADPAQPQRWPRPGLTVLRFANNHAVYAATWLALAAMAAAAVGYLVREERRRTQP
ncbi:SURF1 family protein [Roseateles saccharophilus]|uniref:SURF1-like protein n=1 Tax=Roseateles saccharophilus TaxID=304 RepID=A0A4R3VEQ8_ROSSA|nr:SURF1 family protein [Roseateles saccharophilus]MDG0832753.1 SURF1 family protein [Roseateles saccharophilus]TCV03887.1 surfeit locus 1 family protein [Roseateles saccharophilus]